MNLFGAISVMTQGEVIELNNAAALVIETGATFTDQASVNAFEIDTNNGPAGTVTNLGTFSKTGATAVSTVNVAFTNSGTVGVSQGTLVFAGTFENDGSLVANGAIYK